MTPGPARLALLLCALCAACAAPPPPAPSPPRVTSGLRHFSGTALSGRRPEPEAADRIDAAASLAVRCTFRFAPLGPGEFPLGQDLAPRTATIVARRAGSPLSGASRLAAGARFGEGEPMIVVGETPLAELDAALPQGVTLEFALHERSADATATATDAPIAVLVSRSMEPGDGALRIAFALRGTDAGARTDLQELITVAPGLRVDGGPLWFALPSPFAPASAMPQSAIVVRVAARTPAPDDSAHRAAVAACLDDLRRQGDLERETMRTLADETALARALASGTTAFATAPDLRRAVAFVADRARADVLLDLALSCDETTLRDLADRIAQVDGLAAGLAADRASTIAWTLDALAWRLLAERVDSGRLDDAQRGFLLRRAGELGRFPGGLSALLDRAATASDFDAALIAENQAFLATSDPASRMRAHDWLASRGQAVDGFDPLASPDERSASLDRFEARRGEERR